MVWPQARVVLRDCESAQAGLGATSRCDEAPCCLELPAEVVWWAGTPPAVMPASAPAVPRSGLLCSVHMGPRVFLWTPCRSVPPAPGSHCSLRPFPVGRALCIIPSLFRDGLLWPLSKNLTFSFPFQTSYSLPCLIFSLHTDYSLLYCTLKKKSPVASPDFSGWAIFIHFHQHTTPHGMLSLNERLTLVSSGEVAPLVVLCLHLTWARWAGGLSPP